MSIASLYPSINPSLLLDFANSKVLDPRITFTRTTTATYYDGVTTAVAEQNLLTYSQEFDNAAWSALNVTVSANSTSAPDGTTTADTITEDNTTAAHNVRWSLYTTPASSTTLTISCYAKANGRNYVQLNLQSGILADQYAFAVFDITAGGAGSMTQSIAGAGGSVVSTSITSVGNNWFRCVLTASTTSTTNRVRIGPLSTGTPGAANYGEVSYAGNGTSGVYLWGAQLEQRSSATAYTATTTQAITNYIPVLQTAAAGQARFDHSPTTGESLGLLIEEARTNLCLQSEDFNTGWTLANSTVSTNATIAPNGTVTADKIIPSSTGAFRGLYRTFTASGATTVSVYAKYGGYQWFFLAKPDGSNIGVSFDILNGVKGTEQSGVTGTITSVGNGWYRCTCTQTLTGTAFVQIDLASADNSNSVTVATNDVFSGVFLWGAQAETSGSSFATSYIPTTGSTATRNADAASMTGTNFSSWFGNGEGTVYTEFAKFGVKVYGYLYSISNGATNEEISLNFDSAGTILYARIYSGGGYQMQATLTSSVTDNVFYRNSFGFEVNNSAASWNAGAVVTDSVCTIPNCNALVLAASATGSDIQSCRIKKFAYYPQRVSNTNLVALTT